MPINTINQEWLRGLQDLLDKGVVVKPRDLPVLEITGYQTTVDMESPILMIPSRKLGFKFMAAEAAWILSGDNRVSTIEPFSDYISHFSDDGVTFHGAYGPKIRDQLHYVAQSLINDPDSRQAVMNIWRECPGKTKDVPCTLSLQFVIRKGYIHCIDTMRSSDIWLGWPYDVFNMSMVTRYLISYIRQISGKVYKPGMLTLTAGSFHLYEPQWATAIEILKEVEIQNQIESVTNTVSEKYHWHLPNYTASCDDIIDWLWEVATHGTLTS
jgi:thymidylate synthase